MCLPAIIHSIIIRIILGGIRGNHWIGWRIFITYTITTCWFVIEISTIEFNEDWIILKMKTTEHCNFCCVINRWKTTKYRIAQVEAFVLEVINCSTTTLKSSFLNAFITVLVSGFWQIGLPRSTQIIFSGGSFCSNISRPSRAVEIETRAIPSGFSGGKKACLIPGNRYWLLHRLRCVRARLSNQAKGDYGNIQNCSLKSTEICAVCFYCAVAKEA